MVEMTEAANILNNATGKSLVLFDEIGRGTATFDGLSLAWAITEYLHNSEGVQARTIFATHYHELTELSDQLERVVNFNVGVKEAGEKIVFLRKIQLGPSDKSYGIHVARLAGVPGEVNQRAKDILAQMEAEHLDERGRPKIARPDKSRSSGGLQLSLFGVAEHPILDEIREQKINDLTPLEALEQFLVGECRVPLEGDLTKLEFLVLLDLDLQLVRQHLHLVFELRHVVAPAAHVRIVLVVAAAVPVTVHGPAARVAAARAAAGWRLRWIRSRASRGSR